MELAQESFGCSVLRHGTDFHAAEIYHRKKHFKDWNDVGKRMALLEKFIDLLSMDEIALIDIKVNCDKLHVNQSAEEVGFMFLVERANALMRSRKALGMLIGNRDTDQIAARSAQSLSMWRATGTEFAYGQEIKNLVDSVHFTSSHLSHFLQLADVYAWLKQYLHHNGTSTEQRHQTLLGLVKRHTVNLWPDKYKE